MVLVRGSLYIPAPGSGGGSGGAGVPVFLGPAPGSGQEAASYSGQIVAQGTYPITFTVTAGALPTGLSLNASTGLITGTATTAGNYSFEVTATNADGSASAAFTIGIQGRVPLFYYPLPGTPPGNTFSAVQIGYLFVSEVFGIDNVWLGTFPTFTPSAIYTGSSFGSAPITWSISGTLPDGLAIDSATGEFTGIPTNAAQADGFTIWTMYITAENIYGSLTLGYQFIMQNF